MTDGLHGRVLTVRYRLLHEDGRTDGLMRVKGDRLPIPRVGEYVTLDEIVHGYVYDVNYDYSSHLPEDRVTVAIACDGRHTIENVDCDCTPEHVREWRSYVVTGSKPSDRPDPPDPPELDRGRFPGFVGPDDSDTDTDTDTDHDHD